MNHKTGYNPFSYKPLEITGYWDECNSWHNTCYLHTGLNNPFVICDMTGPGAKKFLEKYLVNTLENRPVGKGMHAILCNDEGKLVSDGILIKTGEEAYRSFCLMSLPGIYEEEKGNFDMTFTDVTGQVVIYQFCGPRSLELIENVTRENMHNLKFMYYRKSSVNGMPVEILRAGMAGTLGYEIHCLSEHASDIYDIVMEAGKQYGLVQLGRHSYRNTHTEGGFTQGNIHFWYADYEHSLDSLTGRRTDPTKPALVRQYQEQIGDIYYDGSLSDAPLSTVFRTPIECGWGKMVRFDHDFIGREALEKEAANPKRVMVSLEWNSEDIMDVWASLFQEGEPYKRMDVTEDLEPYAECESVPKADLEVPGKLYILQDRVLYGDKEIGISSGRVYSPHFRRMISLCTIDKEYAEVGTAVNIVWGNPGQRQKIIRARVAPFPYVRDNRNEKLDVSSIPSGVPR